MKIRQIYEIGIMNVPIKSNNILKKMRFCKQFIFIVA